MDTDSECKKYIKKKIGGGMEGPAASAEKLQGQEVVTYAGTS